MVAETKKFHKNVGEKPGVHLQRRGRAVLHAAEQEAPEPRAAQPRRGRRSVPGCAGTAAAGFCPHLKARRQDGRVARAVACQEGWGSVPRDPGASLRLGLWQLPNTLQHAAGPQ